MIIGGVEFVEVDAPEHGTTYEVTAQGRSLCPLCSTSTPERQHIGFFGGVENLARHLLKQHFKCECGWVGISPRAHLAREPKHGGTSPGGVKKNQQPRRQETL